MNQQGEEKHPQKPPPFLDFFLRFFSQPRYHKCPKKEACASGFQGGMAPHVKLKKPGGGKTFWTYSLISRNSTSFQKTLLSIIFLLKKDFLNSPHSLGRSPKTHPSTLQGISPMDWVGYTDFWSRKFFSANPPRHSQRYVAGSTWGCTE